MLTRTASNVLDRMLTVCCNRLKVLPYEWNSSYHVLLPMTSRVHKGVYWAHSGVQWLMVGFTFGRFLSSIGWDDVPHRIRIINTIYVLAYTLMVTIFVQFQIRRDQIMYFANRVWAQIDKGLGEGEQEGARTTGSGLVSKCAIFGGFLLVVNPPIHGMLMIESPCTPNFLSSLFFPCRTAGEDAEIFLRKLPFLLVESYIVGLILISWSFNWNMIFLGLAWLKDDLRKLRASEADEGENDSMLSKYRELQHITAALNDGFEFYLAWFPSILLGIISLLLFAVFRFYDLPLHSYLMFPGCGLRCMFEAMTPLTLAAHVNQESVLLLRDWRRNQSSKNGEKWKWMTGFLASCPVLKCSAGSFYAFEATIVLTAIHACTQLTLNLLLTVE